MIQYIPITLLGNSLGERHRHLNSIVNDAYKSSISFKTIQDLPEASPVDRLFKIDLASKHKEVNYIIQNLKDADLLYISRALKCTWLLDQQYNHIINPDYLEDELFPEMITPAVTKMKHWIQHNLQDPDRCRIFYEYYKKNEFDIAVKFLRHCSNEFLLEEFNNIMTRIKPKQLKILSENCPKLTKIFYERLEQDRDVLSHYLSHEKNFLCNLKYLLKAEPDTFFDVVEKYYNVQQNRSFRTDITQHIMVHHRNKFFNKAELYTIYLLDKKTLAKCLSPTEAEDLVLKLAKAEYLESWFGYKAVEPFILRLDKDARLALKKKVFVNKDLGDKTTEWPYTLPTSPILEKQPGYSLFLDKVHNPNDYEIRIGYPKKLRCKKRSLRSEKFMRSDCCIMRKKTLLEELFDHYRFTSFESTFFELRTRLRAESSPQNRQFMMLVLVSKCGGRESAMRTLFGLLIEYRNEPVHLRAAIIRSLVKRAFVWRLPADLWSNLLEWAHGLGLDGSSPEAACDEGLHAVVLRNLLADETSEPAVLNAFFDHFTNFTDYTLTTVERSCVRTRFLNLLMTAADMETGDKKLNRLNQLLDTLRAYKIPINKFPVVITAIATAAQDDLKSYEYLLKCLFGARAGRKQLFKINFSLIQNNASYVNALRHDITVLDAEKFKDAVEKNSHKSRLHFDLFLRKLIIFFSEDGGLAKKFYALLKLQVDIKPDKLFARPLAFLAGNNLLTLLKTLDCNTKQRPKTEKQHLSAALRANTHVSRPALDLDVFGWHVAGVKAVANMVSISPKNKREEIISQLSKWKQALRLALAYTEKEDMKYAIFKTLVASKPGAALRAFLHYVKNEKFGDGFLTIWNEVKPVITKLDYKNRDRLCNDLGKVKSIPEAIKSEYYVLVHKVYMNIDERKALPMLCKIENVCFEVDETFLYDTLKLFLENDFTLEKVCVEDYDIYHSSKCSLHIRIIAKFLLLCNSEKTQKKKLEVVGEPFFARFENMWKNPVNRRHLVEFLFEFLTTLKYNKVFFDVKYVSCMPVLERIVTWMQSMELPIEKWFDGYIDIHLTMLYYKAARYCISNKPDYFNSDPINLNKGIDMFGVLFGKLVAHEYEELQLKYFQSIRDIYKKELIDYFVTSLDYGTYDESKERFAIAFIKSILKETEEKEAHLLALHVFKEHVMFYFKFDYDLSEIMNILKSSNDNEVRFNFQTMLPDDIVTERINKIRAYLD